MIALLEGLLRKALPTVWAVNRLGGLQSHIEVTALDRKIEARVFVLDKVQRNLVFKSSMLTTLHCGLGTLPQGNPSAADKR